MAESNPKEQVIAVARDLFAAQNIDVERFSQMSDEELNTESARIDQLWRDLGAALRRVDGEDVRIVKAQISLETSKPTRQVLLYDETREWNWTGDLECGLLEALQGESKSFQYAVLEDSQIVLIGRAPAQEW